MKIKKTVAAALSSALVLCASQGFAIDDDNSPFKIGLNGYTESRVVYATNSDTYGADFVDDNGDFTRYAQDGKIDADVQFSGSISNDVNFNGSMFKYGGEFTLNVHQSSDARDARFRNALVFMESSAGKVILGGSKSASNTFMIHAPTTATGGFSGGSSYYSNQEVGIVPTDLTENIYSGSTSKSYFAAQYLTLAYMPSDLAGNKRYASKFVYITPQFMDGKLQFGLSYMPNSLSYGGYFGNASPYATSVASSYERGNSKHVTSAAALYTHQISSDLVFAASVSGETGKSLDIANAANYDVHRRIRAYGVGFNFECKEVTFGGSYMNHGKSLNIVEDDNTTNTSSAAYSMYNADSYFYTLGASYKQGPITVATNLYNSSKHTNRYKSFGVQAQYNLNGLTPYVEATFYEYTPNKTYLSDSVGNYSSSNTSPVDNCGKVLFAGAVVNF